MRLPPLFVSGLAALLLSIAPVAAQAQGAPPPPIPGPEGAGALRADSLTWIRTALKPAGIALDLPALPDTSVPDIYLVEGGDFSISVEIFPPSGPLTPERLAFVAQAVPDGYRVVSSRPVTRDGIAGIERVTASPDGYQMVEGLYAYRGRLYVVQYLADPGGSLSPNAERLQNSVRFLDPK